MATPRIAHPNFYNKSTGTMYGRLCEAFCCRHINFKTVFQSSPEHAIFIQKIENFLGRGTVPSSNSTPSGTGFTIPALTPSALTAPRPSRCGPSTLGSPLSKLLNTPLYSCGIAQNSFELVLPFAVHLCCWRFLARDALV